MALEKGTVDHAEGDWAWVKVRRKEACAHCQHKHHCHIIEGADRMLVKARNRARARVGDEVEVYLSRRTKLKGMFVLYMFPVLGLMPGASYASSLSKLVGINQTGGMIIFILTGLTLAFLLARFVSAQMAAREERTPLVSRVVKRSGGKAISLPSASEGCDCGLPHGYTPCQRKTCNTPTLPCRSARDPAPGTRP